MQAPVTLRVFLAQTVIVLHLYLTFTNVMMVTSHFNSYTYAKPVAVS